MKNCALVMSKIANDMRLLSSGPCGGIEELQLPARQPGSSIMPGKVNPVIPEVVTQAAFLVAGNDVAISMAVEAGQLELNASTVIATALCPELGYERATEIVKRAQAEHRTVVDVAEEALAIPREALERIVSDCLEERR